MIVPYRPSSTSQTLQRYKPLYENSRYEERNLLTWKLSVFFLFKSLLFLNLLSQPFLSLSEIQLSMERFYSFGDWSSKFIYKSLRFQYIFSSQCSLISEPSEILESILNERFFGHPEAVNLLLDMMRSYRDSKEPIWFNIFGDHGMGKSYAIKLLEEALYISREMSGLLIVSGVNFQEEDDRESLMTIISHQMELCENSLIVIDDAHYVHPETLREAYFLIKRSRYNPLIGLISTSNILERKKADTMQLKDPTATTDARACLENDVICMAIPKINKSFENCRDHHSENILNNPEASWDLFKHYVIALKFLTDSELESVLWYTIRAKTMQSKPAIDVILSNWTLKQMVEQAKTSYPGENGRAMEKWFSRNLFPLIQHSLGNYRESMGKLWETIQEGHLKVEIEKRQDKRVGDDDWDIRIHKF